MSDTIKRTAIWKGLNRSPFLSDGEMRDMKNLSSDAFPFITTRKGRQPYTFSIRIPSPPGEAYNEIERLPEASADELGKIYKITSEPAQDEYVSGEFYYYDAASGSWVQGIKDENFLGDVGEILKYTESGFEYYTLGDCNKYFTHGVTGATGISRLGRVGTKYRYMGESTAGFEYGKVYEYKLDINYYYKSFLSTTAHAYAERVNELPAASEDNIGTTYKLNGEGNTYYTCVADYCGFWEEVKEEQYSIVTKMPSEPENGMQVKYISQIHGAPAEEKFYKCEREVSFKGEHIYYYISVEDAEESIDSSYLPVASEENEGSVYNYIGPKAGDFVECYYTDKIYGWRVVEHPEVTREVTLKEYLEEYKGCGLKEILEIEKFEGSIAALFIDNKGKTKLYHDNDVYEVNNVSDETGKKLVTVGNRLIVGEAGNYLHIKDGVKTFHKVTGTFSFVASGISCTFGRNKTTHKTSYARSSNGKATIELWSYGGDGTGYKDVKSALENPGTGFSLTLKGKTYYMKSESVKCEIEKEMAGWVDSGENTHQEYADILTITATDSLEDFDWDSGRDRNRSMTFASTDPHYYDVVAWKKRLWGYNKNIFHGTIADIFGKGGNVDWVGGEENYNTYMEPISQPLWQGGKITGIAALMEGLLYFKDDCLTIVTGNYPAVMSSDTITCMGLPPDNRRSVAVANESVYYLSADGVYRFSGGIPKCLGRDAKIKGINAVGASDGNKYWLSLQESSGEYALYVYDINYDVWHREDNTQAVSFTMLGSEMYMATSEEVYNISAPQESVDWSFELWYDEDTHRKKKYKEFVVRGDVGECELFLKADDGEWKLIKSAQGEMRAKISPFECEELGVLIRGKGICKIKSIDRVFEVV